MSIVKYAPLHFVSRILTIMALCEWRNALLNCSICSSRNISLRSSRPSMRYSLKNVSYKKTDNTIMIEGIAWLSSHHIFKDPLSDITKQTLSGHSRSTHTLTFLASVATTSNKLLVPSNAQTGNLLESFVTLEASSSLALNFIIHHPPHGIGSRANWRGKILLGNPPSLGHLIPSGEYGHGKPRRQDGRIRKTRKDRRRNIRCCI